MILTALKAQAWKKASTKNSCILTFNILFLEINFRCVFPSFFFLLFFLMQMGRSTLQFNKNSVLELLNFHNSIFLKLYLFQSIEIQRQDEDFPLVINPACNCTVRIGHLRHNTVRYKVIQCDAFRWKQFLRRCRLFRNFRKSL